MLLEQTWFYGKKVEATNLQNLSGLISSMTCALEGPLKEDGIFYLKRKG